MHKSLVRARTLRQRLKVIDRKDDQFAAESADSVLFILKFIKSFISLSTRDMNDKEPFQTKASAVINVVLRDSISYK